MPRLTALAPYRQGLLPSVRAFIGHLAVNSKLRTSREVRFVPKGDNRLLVCLAPARRLHRSANATTPQGTPVSLKRSNS